MVPNMGLRRTVGKLVNRARRAVGIRPDVTARLEAVIMTLVQRIGQPAVLVPVTKVMIHLEPLYCSVCRASRSLIGNGVAPRFAQGFRCGFILVLCDYCWRRIRRKGKLIDTVVNRHHEWHDILTMAGNISEAWENGAGKLGEGGLVN